MGALRSFVADALERHGAIIEPLEPEGLEVLSPEALRGAMGWPELARLGFGAERPAGAIAIGLEGDWLERFGALLGERGRWTERQIASEMPVSMGAPERVLERALDLPNAVWRFQGVRETWTRCLLLSFRYTALSDEKREGLVWLGFNLHTGAVLDDSLVRLRSRLELEQDWGAPSDAARAAAGPRWDSATLTTRVKPLLDACVRVELAPFLAAMRRRLERDRNRIHAYHDDLRRTALKKLAALGGATGEKAEADRKRETMRAAAIEREYHAKLDDLRNNYALRVSVEWVQALELYMPVQRLEVMIRRRKGERLIHLDWHPLLRSAEAPVCEWGQGSGKTRLVCDGKLHLVEPEGLSPCPVCGKVWCRACHPAGCPHCGGEVNRGGRREH